LIHTFKRVISFEFAGNRTYTVLNVQPQSKTLTAMLKTKTLANPAQVSLVV